MHRAKLWLTTVLCLAAALPACAQQSDRAPAIAVVDSPVAERWLARAGVPYVRRTGASLGVAALTGIRLLILPMESVTTDAAVRSVAAFAAEGGRVVAAYWGTLMPQGGATSPGYRLTELLGVRPVGWTGTAPVEVVLDESGGTPPSGGSRLALPPIQATVISPLPGARIVGRWGESDDPGAFVPAGTSAAVVLHGGAIYLAPNLFRTASERPEMRELFFWAIQRVTPDMGPSLQARDRIASAAEACALAQSLLPMNAPPDSRAAMDAAQAALVQARALLARSPAPACRAADRSRVLAETLADRLRGESNVPGQ